MTDWEPYEAPTASRIHLRLLSNPGSVCRGDAVAASNNLLLKSGLLGDDRDDSGTLHDLYAWQDRGAKVLMPHLSSADPNGSSDLRDQSLSANTATAETIARYANDASGRHVRMVVVEGSV